jgi:hypothetical protein
MIRHRAHERVAQPNATLDVQPRERPVKNAIVLGPGAFALAA